MLKLLEQKRFKEAESILEALLKSNPEDPDVLYNLGMLYTEMNKPEKGVKTLLKCIEVDSDYSNAHVALGFAYYKLHNSNTAKEYFLKGLQIDPTNPYALRNLATIFAQNKEFKKALYYYKKADEILPDDPRILFGLGKTYKAIHDKKSADTILKKLISLKDVPENIMENAKQELTDIALSEAKESGFRPDVMYYCISALNRFRNMPIDDVKNICFEIAMLGQKGLDINDPEKKYTLATMPGSYTGLQLVTYMFVGFKKFAPEVDTGVDFNNEFRSAEKMLESGDIQ